MPGLTFSSKRVARISPASWKPVIPACALSHLWLGRKAALAQIGVAGTYTSFARRLDALGRTSLLHEKVAVGGDSCLCTNNQAQTRLGSCLVLVQRRSSLRLNAEAV